MERDRLHGLHVKIWSPLEYEETASFERDSALHWIRLGSPQQIGLSSRREKGSYHPLGRLMAGTEGEVFSKRRLGTPWEIGLRGIYFSPHKTIPSVDHYFCRIVSRPPSPLTSPSSVGKRPDLDPLFTPNTPKHDAPLTPRPNRPRLVGRRQHLFWDWCNNRDLLGGLDMDPLFLSWPFIGFQHRLGGGRCRGVRSSPSIVPELTPSSIWSTLPSQIRQRRSSRVDFERKVSDRRIQQRPEEHLSLTRRSSNFNRNDTHSKSLQCLGRVVSGRHSLFPEQFSKGFDTNHSSTPFSPNVEIAVFMMPTSSQLSSSLTLKPSSLRPDCRAQDRIFAWKGVNTPPKSTIDNPWIHDLETTALEASLTDKSSYGSGLKKFHVFCDLFEIPERERLPTPFHILNSFALWAAADPDIIPSSSPSPPTGSLAESTVQHYLSAIRAWHIAQRWNPPLDHDDRERINFALRGLAKLQAERHKKPPRPPVTTSTLRLVKESLTLSSPFDACVWAIATSAFWGMMRLGEATVKSRSNFTPTKNPTRGDADRELDLRNHPFIRLNLPSAKTAKPGESQSIWLIPQPGLCPVEAIDNLARVVPALKEHPFFSWSDKSRSIRPMTKSAFLDRFNTILDSKKLPRVYGHSFRIGGASHYLANGVNPEIIRIDGRWRSLSYEAYIRSFELTLSHHLGNLPFS